MTSGGRVLRRSDELRSCGVVDGSTVQVVSRMRGGGRHKDKRSNAERKQAANPERTEQKCDEEPNSDEGPATTDMDEALRRTEETQGYQKIIECVSEGSEGEVQQKVQSYLAGIQKLSWVNKEQFEHLEGEVRRAVEAKRRGRGTNRKQTAEKEQ